MDVASSTLIGDNQPMKYVVQLADVLQTSDNAVRMIISLLLGYPLAFLYRAVFLRKSANIQHIFFTICGLSLCYFNYGWDILHSVINILLIYIVLLVAGGTVTSVILAFVINMSYLCIGYYCTMSETYSIKWTTPHCVLCLRLIGLVYDVYDGSFSEEKLSAEQKESSLKETPSLLEISGHTYFFGGFLVGPQFAMKRYLDFVHGRFLNGNDSPNSLIPAMEKLATGFFYIFLFQLTCRYFPDSHLTTSELLESSSFWQICLFVILWSKFMLYKYVGCWLITEGTCTLCGLTYNGKSEDGKEKWDGCANICVSDFEKASTCQELVSSFNVNTNKWMGKYIFKRLKFMGSKDLSQLSTLGFLAIWHGLYSGYFMNFALEFFLIKFERDFSSIPAIQKLVDVVGSVPGGNLFIWVIKKIHLQYILGYSLISFCLFTWPRYMKVYGSMYYFVHIFYVLLWPIVFFAYRKTFKRSTRAAAAEREKSS